MITPEDKTLLIIAGPTAVGKTEASILLAKELRAEIVSADSMQIYRGMDIGTAKPTKEQRKLVSHHMIDIVEPDHPYSVGDYLRDARRAIDSIIAAGSTPLVSGGTGLYIRALTRGLFQGPSADSELRKQLLQREAEEEPGKLYRDLAKLDPDAAIQNSSERSQAYDQGARGLLPQRQNIIRLPAQPCIQGKAVPLQDVFSLQVEIRIISPDRTTRGQDDCRRARG